MAWTEAHAYGTVISRTVTRRTWKRINPLVWVVTTSDHPMCIHLAAKINSQKTNFVADTGSMVSIIKSTVVNTGYATPTTTNLQNSKRSIRKMTLSIVKHWFLHNYNLTTYIADFKDSLLGLPFLKVKDISINCGNLTVTDKITKFTSTGRQQFTRSTVLQVCFSRFF